MDVSAYLQGHVQVFVPRGRIDQTSADGFRLALAPFLAACTEEAPPLVLDFAAVPYISSVGLRVLMLASRQVREQNGRLAIAGLTAVVHEVFEISRFDLLLDVFTSVDAAVAALA